MTPLQAEKEIHLLEILRDRPDVGQRDMAEAIGLSLGMTNLLVKELSAKGWMLARKLNARKVQYCLTPEGLRELSRRSYRYLKKSIRHVADCRAQLETLVVQAKNKGFAGVALVGSSEVDFVIESLCRQHHLGFLNRHQGAVLDQWFVVHGENELRSPNVIEFLEPALP